MVLHGRQRRSFDGLNELAQRLDIRLGVEDRKQILAGNEALTLATDAQDWSKWMAEVEARLRDVVGNDTARDLLVQTWMPSEDHELSAADTT